MLEWFTWDSAKNFLNSEFISAALGALAGAGFGAWAAQRIAERSKQREQLLQELRNTNAAISLAQILCNNYLNLKEQHIRALKQGWDVQRELVLAHREGELELGALDLRSLTNPPVRVDRLDEAILEKVTVSGRPISVAGALAISVEQLREVIATWNKRVAAYKALPAVVDSQRIAYLFGLPHGNVIDTSFADNISALYALTDDCIFFSWLLTLDLARHGTQTRRDFLQLGFGGLAPRVAKIDWSVVEKKGLLPPREHYSTWFTGFVRRLPHTHGRRLAKLRYSIRRWLRCRGFRRRCLFCGSYTCYAAPNDLKHKPWLNH